MSAEHALLNYLYHMYKPYTAFLPQKVSSRTFQTLFFFSPLILLSEVSEFNTKLKYIHTSNADVLECRS